VRNTDRDQGEYDKRERIESISLYSKSDPQDCRAESPSCQPLALTAAVTGTAGISIPGIIGGTIPGIYGYKNKPWT
jgi:hypothetical protein